MNGRAALALIGTAALLGSVEAAAQSRPADRLAAATRIECRFTALATGNWEDAGPTASVDAADLEAEFFEINVGEGTAEAGGDFGAAFIVVRYSEGYLHFLQMGNAGPLRVTTVLAHETADGRLKAVHTRHEYTTTALPGFTSRPEMYVGDCTVET